MFQSFIHWLQSLVRRNEERMAGVLALLLGFVFMPFFWACYHAIAAGGD